MLFKILSTGTALPNDTKLVSQIEELPPCIVGTPTPKDALPPHICRAISLAFNAPQDHKPLVTLLDTIESLDLLGLVAQEVVSRILKTGSDFAICAKLTEECPKFAPFLTQSLFSEMKVFSPELKLPYLVAICGEISAQILFAKDEIFDSVNSVSDRQNGLCRYSNFVDLQHTIELQLLDFCAQTSNSALAQVLLSKSLFSHYLRISNAVSDEGSIICPISLMELPPGVPCTRVIMHSTQIELYLDSILGSTFEEINEKMPTHPITRDDWSKGYSFEFNVPAPLFSDLV